ncbi:hypothetical protein [Vibrio owensii]|uniref:hypothetical protein n=1 Tax=Vibrio harveyi group TaxID=717610 RepID=UPI003CC68955
MSNTFTAEVDALFSTYDKNSKSARDIEITKSYYGITGNGKTSMELVGKPYGLTRESVRQIMGRVVSEIDHPAKSDVLEKCFLIISKQAPISAKRLETILSEEGIIPEGFMIEGVINAIDLFTSYKDKYVIVKENDHRFVVPVKLSKAPKDVLSKATKEISHNGATSVSVVAKTLSAKLPSTVKTQFVIDVVSTVDEMDWIDTDSNWFYFGDKGRNRLLQRLERIFSLISSAKPEDIYLAMDRAWNKNRKAISQVPPAEIIASIAKVHPSYDLNEEGEVIAIVTKGVEVLTDYEAKLAHALIEAENHTLREKTLEDTLVENPKEKYAFSQALNYSPLVVKRERGVYSLVGTPK